MYPAVEGVVFAVMGVSILADIGFTVLFFRSPELREGPGLLIFAQNQAQIILDLHWLSILWSADKPTGCTVIGFLTMTAFMLSCAYAAAICVAVACSETEDRENRESRKNLRWVYHVVCGTVALAITVAMAAGKGLGKSALQTCSIEQGTWAE